MSLSPTERSLTRSRPPTLVFHGKPWAYSISLDPPAESTDCLYEVSPMLHGRSSSHHRSTRNMLTAPYTTTPDDLPRGAQCGAAARDLLRFTGNSVHGLPGAEPLMDRSTPCLAAGVSRETGARAFRHTPPRAHHDPTMSTAPCAFSGIAHTPARAFCHAAENYLTADPDKVREAHRRPAEEDSTLVRVHLGSRELSWHRTLHRSIHSVVHIGG